MSLQHQLKAVEVEREVSNKDDRWSSAPKQRTFGRWLSDSSLSVNFKSQIEPPRRPRKNHPEPGRWVSDSGLSVNCKFQIDPPRRPRQNDGEPMPHEDFRLTDDTVEHISTLIPIQPKRRKSIGKLVDEFQDVTLSKNNCQLPLSSNDLVLSYQKPNIKAAISA